MATGPAAAAAHLLRGVPLFRPRIHRAVATSRCFTLGLFTANPPQLPDTAISVGEGTTTNPVGGNAIEAHPPLPPRCTSWMDHPEYRRWKDKEDEILKDIEPVTFLTKDILHSNRYMDGERLSAEDEKEVLEKLLAYHPHSEDKIGCGLDYIMVDRHPQFRNSRCLFVVRTDGGWIDFSYQKCLRAYIREKYPSYAERFTREHFRRT